MLQVGYSSFYAALQFIFPILLAGSVKCGARKPFLNSLALRSVLKICAFLNTQAEAVPSFSRQTGLPCASCHHTYPELTYFGRMFNLNGYTLTGIKQIVVKGKPRESPLRVDELLPLSAFIQLSTTGVNAGDKIFV